MLGDGPSLLGLSAVLAATLASAQVPEARSRGERLLDLRRGEAASYAIFRDAARKEKLELRPEPVYRWSNPTRSGGQEGDVFLWTCKGRLNHDARHRFRFYQDRVVPEIDAGAAPAPAGKAEAK